MVWHDSGSLCILDHDSQCYVAHQVQQKCKADPCLYNSWTKTGLVLWLSWVDDCLVCGRRENVEEASVDILHSYVEHLSQ